MSFLRGEIKTPAPTHAENEAALIKEKYGYASFYLSCKLAEFVSDSAKEIIAITDPKEALIECDEYNLNKKIASLDNNIEKIYVLLSLTNENIYMNGLEKCLSEEELSDDALLEKRISTEIEHRRKLKVDELYEAAGKITLGNLMTLGHSVCMMIDRKNKKVIYKDPYGKTIPENIKQILINTFSIPSENIVSHTQKQQHPEDHSNCSLFSLENLLSFKNGQSFLDVSNNYVVKMQEIRKKYAEFVKPQLEQFMKIVEEERIQDEKEAAENKIMVKIF